MLNPIYIWLLYIDIDQWWKSITQETSKAFAKCHLCIFRWRKKIFRQKNVTVYITSPCFINMKLHLECQIIEQRNKGLIAADIFYLYANSSDF